MGDGYVFELGALVVSNGSTVIGVIVDRARLGHYDDMFVYDICWTGRYTGIYSTGWTPCEIAPVDETAREQWELHYPAHGKAPWHSCASCAIRAMVDM